MVKYYRGWKIKNRGRKMKADNPIDWTVKMWWDENDPWRKRYWMKELAHIIEMEKYRRPPRIEHWRMAILAAQAIVNGKDIK